jgi:glycosyltransferase involved in cell wall biosynthesis
MGPLPPPINGMSKAFDMLVHNLPSYGWEVRTVDTADRTSGRIDSAFSISRALGILRALGRAWRLIPMVDVVYLTIAQSRWGFAKDVLVVNAAAAAGRPVVAHMHGGNFAGFYDSLSRLEQALVRRTLHRLSRVVVLAEGLKADFRMMRDWSARTVPVSNTCDVPICQPRQLRPDRLRVLYLSNLMVSKGYRDVILAVAELAKHRPRLQIFLDVAGALHPGTDFPNAAAQRSDLDDLLRKVPATARATYHGSVDGVRKEALLRDADLFVLPTWYVNEGQPISVLEALTSGLPVIATDWRGIRESLPEEMMPLLVPAKDPQAISSRLAWLLDRPDAFSAMSQAAVRTAETYRPDCHLKALDQILRGTLLEHRAFNAPGRWKT